LIQKYKNEKLQTPTQRRSNNETKNTEEKDKEQKSRGKEGIQKIYAEEETKSKQTKEDEEKKSTHDQGEKKEGIEQNPNIEKEKEKFASDSNFGDEFQNKEDQKEKINDFGNSNIETTHQVRNKEESKTENPEKDQKNDVMNWTWEEYENENDCWYFDEFWTTQPAVRNFKFFQARASNCFVCAQQLSIHQKKRLFNQIVSVLPNCINGAESV